jgi:hypothetical protein
MTPVVTGLSEPICAPLWPLNRRGGGPCGQRWRHPAAKTTRQPAPPDMEPLRGDFYFQAIPGNAATKCGGLKNCCPKFGRPHGLAKPTETAGQIFVISFLSVRRAFLLPQFPGTPGFCLEGGGLGPSEQCNPKPPPPKQNAPGRCVMSMSGTVVSSSFSSQSRCLCCVCRGSVRSGAVCPVACGLRRFARLAGRPGWRGGLAARAHARLLRLRPQSSSVQQQLF